MTLFYKGLHYEIEIANNISHGETDTTIVGPIYLKTQHFPFTGRFEPCSLINMYTL